MSMWLTLLALISAAAVASFAELFPLHHFPLPIAALMWSATSLLFLLALFLNISLLSPLARLEQAFAPNLMTLMLKKKAISFYRLSLMIGAFVAYLFSLAFLVNEPYRLWFFLSWWVIFGMMIDLFRKNWSALAHLLSPFHLVKEVEVSAKEAVRDSQDHDLWAALDTLCEMALSATKRQKIALATQIVQTFSPILGAFYRSSKSISRLSQDEQVAKETGQDEISYTLFYFLQRLELIYDQALAAQLQSLCRQIVMTLGRIILQGAKLDLSLLPFPMRILVQFALQAQQRYLQQITELANSTIVEIAKTVVQEADLAHAELLPPFMSMIKGLENIAKGHFKQNKFADIDTLTQPLTDLKKLLKHPNIAQHADLPFIEKEMERALAEFEALKQVMAAMPTIQGQAETEPLK